MRISEPRDVFEFCKVSGLFCIHSGTHCFNGKVAEKYVELGGGIEAIGADARIDQSLNRGLGAFSVAISLVLRAEFTET